MLWHAIRMTYQGTVSTLGTLTCPFSLSLALSLSAVDGGDVKVDRWGWQPDNRLLSVCYCALRIPCAPCPPPLHIALFSFKFTPFPQQHCSPYLPSFFSPFTPTYIINKFPTFSTFSTLAPFPHSPFFYPVPLWPHANRGLH